MLFSSIAFLIFLMIFFPLFYLSGKKARPVVFMLSSLFFYMNTQTFYIAVTILWILANFFFISKLKNLSDKSLPQRSSERSPERSSAEVLSAAKRKRKKFYFISGVCFNVFALFFFKYTLFLTDNANSLIHIFIPSFSLPYLSILIPLGISFITFKSISFLIEIYRGNYNKSVGLFNYAQYILFFPGVLAGPIDRPGKLMPQLENLKQDLNINDLKKGLAFILWGLFQKAVIADRIGLLINGGLNNPENSSGGELLIFVFLYSVQIYCDFAGYSNIALGTAKLFGIDIMQNFERPYFSKSIGEFWRKWHISLSSWLRDYLFLPLAYKYARKLTLRNLELKSVERYSYVMSVLITMLIAGFWHGAGWTFVFWGFLMAFYMIFGFYTKKFRRRFFAELFRKAGFKYNSKIKAVIQTSVNFLLITFAWIFFRAESFSSAIITIRKILMNPFENVSSVFSHEMIFAGFLVFVYFTIEYLQNKKPRIIKSSAKSINAVPAVYRFVLYVFAAFFIFSAGYFSISQFIYAQF